MLVEKETQINENVSFVFEQVHDFKHRYIMLFNSNNIEDNKITLELIDHKFKNTYTKTFDVFFIKDFNMYCFKDQNIYDLRLIAQNFITFEIEFQMKKIEIDQYNLYLNM